jgi:hypothetical protein
MACAVVSHCSAKSFLQGQTQLGASRGLDLTLLVDAQYKGLLWGIEMHANNIVKISR